MSGRFPADAWILQHIDDSHSLTWIRVIMASYIPQMILRGGRRYLLVVLRPAGPSDEPCATHLKTMNGDFEGNMNGFYDGVCVFTIRVAPSHSSIRFMLKQDTLSVLCLYLIPGMNSLNEGSGTWSAVLPLPAVESAPAAAAKGAVPALRGRGGLGYWTYN